MSRIVGLIGWPVEHSRSPAMHNAAFEALGLAWRYILLPTPLDQLVAVVARIRSGELQGANVTIPHKQAVMSYLDEIDLVAQAVGAVNTIVKQTDRLIGFNTDTLGFKRSLIETGVDVRDQPCAILGAGGSARAVVYVLHELGAHVTVYARDIEKAHAVHANCRSLSTLSEIDPTTKLIVNTTPVGLSPNADASPWPDDVPLPKQALIFDLLNNPARTQFMQQAEQAGLRAVNGWNMLVYQGAAAFAAWTGIEPPVDVMKRALVQSMKED
ncbi:MAG TPA: shikimate dehydrogenase [Anaerolineae bacterium]|nr:shikimate dehydrogenase [Anaerolineae bacterium]